MEEEEQGEVEVNLTYENIVATVRLRTDANQPIPLSRLQSSIRNAEYNPKRFPAMIMRIREPRTTALVFQNGKMIVTGRMT